MKDDPDLHIDEVSPEDITYSPKRRRIGSGNSNALVILLAVFLVLIFAAGIFYFLRRPTGEASLLQSKMIALEEKITALEKQLGELQGKISASGPDPAPALLQRVDGLAQKVEALEKQKRPAVESKAKPSPPPKPATSTEKQYHTVQKGETLYRISKKYGISVGELRKLNNLSADRPLRTGQKLLVSKR